MVYYKCISVYIFTGEAIDLIIFFPFSVNIGNKRHSLYITNTSEAWNALRESALKDSIVSKPPPKKTRWFGKITNMVRFVRRSTIAAGLKVPGDDNPYNDTFIVSVRK